MESEQSFFGHYGEPLRTDLDVYVELPLAYREALGSIRNVHSQKVQLIGHEGEAALKELGNFGGSVSDQRHSITITSSLLTEAMRYADFATVGRSHTTGENEKLRRRLLPHADVYAGFAVHGLIKRLSETSYQPLDVVRANLDAVEWRSITDRLIEGIESASKATTHITVTDELRAKDPASPEIASHLLQCSLEYGSQVTMITAAALLSGHRKTILNAHNALYGQHNSGPDYPIRYDAETKKTVFVDDDDQPMHVADFASAMLHQSAYGHGRMLLDALLQQKDYSAAQAAQRRILERANDDSVWRAFALGASKVITDENIRELYPEAFGPGASEDEERELVEDLVELVIDREFDGQILPGGAPGSGEARADEFGQVQRRAKKPNVFVDSSRYAMLKDLKDLDPEAISVRGVFAGKNVEGAENANEGERESKDYVAIVVPLRNASEEVVAHFVLAESLEAGRNSTFVYRTDAGTLTTDEFLGLDKPTAASTKGVRILHHRRVGGRSVNATTSEKALYLMTCTPEEYLTARFDGEHNGKLRVRVGRVALNETVEPAED